MNGPNKPIKRQRLLRVDKKFKKKYKKKDQTTGLFTRKPL